MATFSHYSRPNVGTYTAISAATLTVSTTAQLLGAGVDDAATAVSVPVDASGAIIRVEMDQCDDFIRTHFNSLVPTAAKGEKFFDGNVLYVGDTENSKGDPTVLRVMQIIGVAEGGTGSGSGKAYITYYKRT